MGLATIDPHSGTENWALALVKGNREPHEAKKKSFDLGGNRTHDLRIRLWD